MKTFLVILTVAVMAAASLWGVYAPSFAEAYIMPVQISDASGTPLGTFQCRPVADGKGSVLLVFRHQGELRRTTGGMVREKIVLSYKGEPFFSGIVPGPMEAVAIPADSLPPAFRPYAAP